MIKKLIALGTVIGAAAVLSNKSRRDRLMGAAKELMKSASEKASSLSGKTGADSKSESMSGSNGSSPSTSTPGAYTRPGSF